MSAVPGLEWARLDEWTDERIVERVLAGEQVLFELLMRRHNQRIYRAVRSILREDGECEDVMQEAYVRAYEHLAQFEGRAQFSTWLTRIAVNEALKRQASRGRLASLDGDVCDGGEERMPEPRSNWPTPEAQASRGELARLLEQAILSLPCKYRSVILLRDVEGMSTNETAEALSLTDTNVKVRLHRGHELLQEEILSRLGGAASQAFLFQAPRCDRVVSAVSARLALRNAGAVGDSER